MLRFLTEGRPDVIADVIFVHGIRMHRVPVTDWLSAEADEPWTEWIAQDFQRMRVGVLSYQAASSRWFGSGMHLEDRARNVLATLRLAGVGDRPVVFVTHSLGGLVVKEMLLLSSAMNGDNRRVADRCAGVVFLGTPHTGAGIASTLSAIPFLRPTWLLRGLKRDDPHLVNLSGRYRDWTAQQPGVRHLVLREAEPVGGVMVVKAGSGDAGIPEAAAIAVDANHLTIAAPPSREGLVYQQVSALLQEVSTDIDATDGRGPGHLLEETATTSQRARLASRADFLPAMPRPDLVDRLAKGETKVQVVFGEGGSGKSVLAGQVFDEVHSLQPCILVACASLRLSQRGEGVEEVDLALGRLATQTDVPLTTVTSTFDRPPMVILDTVDLLLNQTNGDEIAELLRRLSETADVIVTCRGREWHDLLAPFTSDLDIESMGMPALSPPEVVEWVDAFLTAEGTKAAAAERFRASIRSALNVRRGVVVLGVPLRLAMACRLYIVDGAIPEDLTATRLYSEYWTARVDAERDGRRNTPHASAKRTTALRVAQDVWRQSIVRLVEDVLAPADLDATNALVSEGVLVRHEMNVHFFHQTFAEFAISRYLMGTWADTDLARLAAGLLERVSGSWGIVGHLVGDRLTDDQFDMLLSILPLHWAEGARVGIVGSLARTDPARVRQRFQTSHVKSRRGSAPLPTFSRMHPSH